MNPSPKLPVSVIIPTYNRSAELQTTLHALCRQTYPADEMEVVVVADGCSDDTTETLRAFRAPFSLRVIEQSNQGAGAARNRGAREARGEILIFLDDDIEATPQLVEAHLRAHHDGPGQVVIGYLPTILPGKKDFFEAQLRNWWEAMFQRMRQPGYRFQYTDLLSGNFSLESRFFAQVGGFNPNFRCHEDYEIGVRLLRAGARFRFAPDATGYHHELTDLDRSLRRKYQEGIADVALGRCYPELIPTLLMVKLKRYSLLASRILQVFAFRWPAAGDCIVAFFQRSLAILEKAKVRKVWRRVLYGLLGYWYWRGVAVELRTGKDLELFLATDPGIVRQEIFELDLQSGLEEAERLLDLHAPSGVSLRYGEHDIGVIPAVPWAEPLRGAHLRNMLATRLAAPMLKALALEGKLRFPGLSGKIVAACDEQIPLLKSYDISV